MTKTWIYAVLLAFSVNLFCILPATGQITLLANGTLTGSTAGSYADLSGLTDTLENGVPANLLGGLGSGLAWAKGGTFLALPDRGPNAVSFDSLIDDTVTYIPRFQTVTMTLKSNTGSGLPYILTPTLQSTTLLFDPSPLYYGDGAGLGVGPGAPAENSASQFYFSGRSDNFDPTKTSGSAANARLDAESIRMSNDGQTVFISDEYGPYVYQFQVADGQRIRSYRLPGNLFVANQSPVGADEIANNVSGRTANKGMEGLAITPDGKTLVGIMQAALLQDASLGGAAKNLLRIVTVDVASGKFHEYAYLLTTGSGASDIVALNRHEFLVDERDGHGLGDGTDAVVKQIFKIDLAHAIDVTKMDGLTAAANAVNKTLFLDVVQLLTDSGITADQIPAKLEGLALGRDISNGGALLHTLWLANDNDFLQDYAGTGTNPNQFYVFGFSDSDLAGSTYVPQHFTF